MKKGWIVGIIGGFVLLGALLVISSNYFITTTPARQPLYWVDPMEPQIHYPGPGKSRMNMELVPVYPESLPQNQLQNTVFISPSMVNNLGVRTARVEESNLAKEIETVGYVEPNENNISHIHTYVEGWIRKLIIKAAGEKVAQGQLLFQLYSPILVNAQQEYLLALESGNAPLIKASHHKLQILRVADTQIEEIKRTHRANQLVDIFSPQDGFIQSLKVREGMWVAPETEVMSIIDLSSVWIIAQIFEQQAGSIAIGQEAYAKLSAFPERLWKGKVEYIYPEVEPTTRTLKIRFLFQNPDLLLKPNMYANITLFAEPKRNTLSIPLEALIRSSEGNRVIVSLGEGRFQVRAVMTGIETNERIEILSGLQKNEKVVTSGQFLIDSEASLKASLQRMESSKEEKQ